MLAAIRQIKAEGPQPQARQTLLAASADFGARCGGADDRLHRIFAYSRGGFARSDRL